MTPTKLLIADDDRVILATLTESLIERGYQVQSVANGSEAVDACQKNSPDLAILDIRMPVMNGIDAARIIQKECGTPVMFLSAYSDQALVESAVAAGTLGYLVKPVTPEKLIPAIATALARAQDMYLVKQSHKNLTLAMNSKREIDIAIGMLLERFNLNRDLAFEVLRRLARSKGRKIGDIALDLIERTELFAAAQDISFHLTQKNKDPNTFLTLFRHHPASLPLTWLAEMRIAATNYKLRPLDMNPIVFGGALPRH